MLSTFGLQHLEEALDAERTAADDVAKYLEQAARKALPQAPASAETQHRRVEVHSRLSVDEPGLPTHPFAHAQPNPQFHRTQYANRV
jgi:hypothetical protein